MSENGQGLIFLARKFNIPHKSQFVFHWVLFRSSFENLIVSLVNLAISIAMIDVGVQNQEACKNNGAQYLVVNGSFLLVLSILGCCIGSCIRYHDTTTAILWIRYVGGITQLIILIWGSVTVFGKLFWIHN